MSANTFRTLVLAMQGASEGAHMGHPDFRANGRIFASLHADQRSGNLKLQADEQAELVATHPKTFSAANGAWGRQGWTSIRFDSADPATVRAAIVLAFEAVTALPRKPADRRQRKENG